MKGPFDFEDLGLEPGESASVINGAEHAHTSDYCPDLHHDAWFVSRDEDGDYDVDKDHVTDQSQWDAWDR